MRIGSPVLAHERAAAFETLAKMSLAYASPERPNPLVRVHGRPMLGRAPAKGDTTPRLRTGPRRGAPSGPPASSSSEHPPHGLDQLVFVGEFPRLELGVQPLAAHRQLEASPFRRDHHVAADLALVARQELGRQTDGLRLVVSEGAVFENDFHRAPPSSGSRFAIDRRITVEGRPEGSGRGLDRTPRRGGFPWAVQVSSHRVGIGSIDFRPSMD
jgi:hypothetical protein